MVVVMSKAMTVLLFLSSSSSSACFCSAADLTSSTGSTPFYITYFFERIHQKEPISVRVRWNPERYQFFKWILVIVIQLVSFKAFLRRSCLGSPCVVVLLDCKEKDNNATLGLKIECENKWHMSMSFWASLV
jgi:hypothetical protein